MKNRVRWDDTENDVDKILKRILKGSDSRETGKERYLVTQRKMKYGHILPSCNYIIATKCHRQKSVRMDVGKMKVRMA